MIRDQLRNILVIAITLLIAILLSIVPLPMWLNWFRPAWVIMTIIFWAYALPYRFGIFVPWMLGLLVDIIYGTYLGEHALAFSLIAYITIKLQQRMQIFSDWQRWFTVMALLAFYQLIIFITQSVFGHTPMTWYYWASPITSAILWPAWSGLLSLCQRRFRVVDQLPMRRFTYGREL